MAFVKIKKEVKKELPKIVGVLKARVKPECSLVYTNTLGVTINLEVHGLLPLAIEKLIECTDDEGYVTLEVIAPVGGKDGSGDNDN